MTWNDIWADMDALKANMQRLVDEDATDEAAVRQLKAMDETYRKALPAGYWRTISVPEFAAHHGFPADPDLDDQHTARDGSQWTFDGDRWELREYAPDNLAQLLDAARAAQEAAEREVQRLTEERDEAEACCGCEHGGHHVLPTPDETNPAHLRWAADLADEGCAPGTTLGASEFLRARANRLEAAQTGDQIPVQLGQHLRVLHHQLLDQFLRVVV